MASTSSHAGGSKKRRSSVELPALPAPKRPFPLALPAPKQEFLALPAPNPSIRALQQHDTEPPLFELNVLLPNGGNVILHVEVDEEVTVRELVRKVKRTARKDGTTASTVHWGPHVYLEDDVGNRIEDYKIFDCNETSRVLFLQDGQPHSIHALQDMWNVTPDPELLVSLPQDYTVETALADLLDNSLQAVWANLPGERRFISVTLQKDKITIFDSGPGMDSTSENSIAKWGTMGSSKHRSVRVSAVGGKPPFLQPYFGMYGFGGLTAAMYLGSVAVVSSKTKLSKKVVSLTLEKEKLMERCKTDRSWKTAGEYREPPQDALKDSPHGSFTKVELSKLRKGIVWTEKEVMCMLKDIYFPYIQCDDADNSQGTMTPVEFKVNETNLTEVDGGEVALTNMSSCNGTPFVIDIHMKRKSELAGPFLVNDLDRATARVKCHYFPIQRGKESIDNILNALRMEGATIKETFENFCRVSIRRLGRLLPDARWRRLPFMEPKRKRGDKSVLPKICFERVKAFVDTDAGFIPTTSKMDLLSGHIFTNLLKSLGTRGNIPEDVTYEIYRGTRLMKLQEVEKEYEDWIREMHDLYDEEVECQNEQYIIAMANADELGFSQKVYRIYEHLNRKGMLWKQGMKVRFYKGVPGYKTADFYATLEYFLSDGLLEDRGNTKAICRPIDIAKADGSRVTIEDEEVGFALGKSKAIPIEFLALDKCEIVHERDWIRVSDNKWLHEPGAIDILDREILQSLGVDGGITLTVKAGIKPFDSVYAVIRPNSFARLMQDGRDLNQVDQKHIVKKSMQMKLELRQLNGLASLTSRESNHENLEKINISLLSNAQSIRNIHGFYCFSMDQTDFKRFYTIAGKYTVTFSLLDQGSVDRILERSLEVTILPSDTIGRWTLEPVDESEPSTVRVGSEIGPLILHCWDEYKNVKDVTLPPETRFEVWSRQMKLNVNLVVEGILPQEKRKSYLIIKALKFTGGLLTGIAKDYSGTLQLTIAEEHVASMDISVLPGEMSSIQVLNIDDLDDGLQSGDAIHTLTLQVLDKFGNHVERGCKVLVQLDNLELQDSDGYHRTVDEEGCIKLGGLLKVIGPFNATATITVCTAKQKLLYYKEFSLKRRRLQIVSEIPEEYAVGGVLRNIRVEIVDENGRIDKTMSGSQHTLVVSHGNEGAYPLREGSCCLQSIQLPNLPGPWCCHINHGTYQELGADIKLNLVSNFEHTMDFTDVGGDDDDDGQPLMVPGKTGSQKASSGSRGDLQKLATLIIERVEELKRRLRRCSQKLEKAESELEKLNSLKNIEACSISELEGEIRSLQTQAENVRKGCQVNEQDKSEITVERVAQDISNLSVPTKFFIEAFCSDYFLSAKSGSPHILDIVGVVCLLASTGNEAVSRALAEFIRPESMLAVVCKTHDAVELLIKLKSDGSIDETCGLYDYLRSQKQDLHEKLRVYILEDMRWYDKGIEESDPQRVLKLNPPKLKSGQVPKGFLGYAVNMLHLNVEHLEMGGRQHGGLRGSLFYTLFQDLQVYDNHGNLLKAKDALTTGGISLDGGLIRERGCTEFGSRHYAKIIFPVHSRTGERIPSLRSIDHTAKSAQIRNTLKRKQQELQDHKVVMENTESRMDYVKRRIKSREEKYKATRVELQTSNEELQQLTKTMDSL